MGVVVRFVVEIVDRKLLAKVAFEAVVIKMRVKARE